MDKEQINKQLGRYKETIAAIKKREGFKSVRTLAEQMNYSRGETISEYGNIKHYKPRKFQDFVGLLSRVFDVNPEYILNGNGSVFQPKATSPATLQPAMSDRERQIKIEGLEYARALLEEQLRILKQKAASLEK